MGVILLEALLAMALLVGIVWWTMFSGRDKGELPPASPSADGAGADAIEAAPSPAAAQAVANPPTVSSTGTAATPAPSAGAADRGPPAG